MPRTDIALGEDDSTVQCQLVCGVQKVRVRIAGLRVLLAVLTSVPLRNTEDKSQVLPEVRRSVLYHVVTQTSV